MDLIKELNKEALPKETANVQVGDTVRVHVKVKEGPSRQAVLSAWPRGQGRQGQGEAVISFQLSRKREAKASLFLL